MSTALRSLHWPAVAGATFFYYFLAVPWFAPFAFGPAWLTAVGPGGDDAAAYVVPLIGAVAATVAVAVLQRRLGIQGVAEGVRLGLVVALCFSATAVATDAAAPNQAKPLTFFFIVGGYHLVGLTVASAVLARFRGGRDERREQRPV